jgi:hypothetical protein
MVRLFVTLAHQKQHPIYIVVTLGTSFPGGTDYSGWDQMGSPLHYKTLRS